MPIVDTSWLQRRLDDPAVVVCDVRSTMGGADPWADHGAGHVPGAILVVLDDTLATSPGGVDGRHPLPTAETFASALGALGVADDATVVAYDDRGGAFASRLVWMLRIIGQDARLLDGGLAAWSGELARDTTPRAPVTRVPTEWPTGAIADADDVTAHIRGGGIVIDSRDRARYLGETEPIDPVAGHVPGAVNVPFADNLDDDGRFLPSEALARRFAAADGDDAVIVYCGSGVTACHNALAMEHAGLARPRVYVGSWSGWIADPDRTVATGPTP